MDMAVVFMATVDTLPIHTLTAMDIQPLTATDTAGSTSVKLMLIQRLMPSTAASMVWVLTDTAVDSMATVDTLPTNTLMGMDTQPLTAMVLTGSTSVRLMLSQRLMPSMVASMVLVLMDMADSMATADTLPTHTPMDTDTQPLTAMDTAVSTSVRLMLSQRLMLSMLVFMDMDTHLMDTAHTLMLPHTPMDTAAQLSLMDTTKLLLTL